MNRTGWRPLTVIAAVVVMVTGLAGPAAATFPGDNGRIAFRRYFNPEHTRGAVFTMRPDGSGERQVTHPPAGFFDDDPDWSPNGERLAFIRVNRNACGVDCLSASLFVIEADGSDLKQLTSSKPGVDCANGGGCAAGPAWSPDGKTIAFQRQTGPLIGEEWAETAIYLIGADGRGLTQVTQQQRPSTGSDDAPQFSPDGRTLAFERRNIRGALPVDGMAVWTVRVDGRHEKRLTPWRLRGGDTTDWSPDGKRILFESNENGSPDVSANIYSIRKDGSDLRQLTFAHGGGVQHFASSYSPDGRHITFARTPGVGPDGNADIYKMTVDGHHVRRVTSNPLWESRPDWGPSESD